jgi:hypothetical protein
MKKKKIKIIKREDLKNQSKTPFPDEKNKLRKAKREMLSTVSGWVAELPRLRCEESKQAFELLFAPPLVPAQSK